MSEFAAWGPQQSGPRIARQDQQASLLNDLGAVEAVGKIQMQPAQRALAEAHARLYGTQADLGEMDLAIRKKVASRMSELGSSGTDEEMADQLDKVAKIYLQSGDTEKARLTAASAEQYRARQAMVLQRNATTAQAQLTTQGALLEKLGLLARGASDQPSLDRALMMGTEMVSGIQDPQTKAHAMKVLQAIPRDYEQARPVLDQLLNSTRAGLDDTRMQLRERDVQTREQLAGIRERVADTTRALREAQEALARERAEKLKREGGRAPDPNKEVAPAAAFIRSQLGVPAGTSVEGLAVGATELADKARVLMRQNPALTYSQAVAQSFDSSDWEPPKSGWTGSTSAKFLQPGASARKPLPLPASKNVAELKKDAWYSDGSAAKKWTGAGWSEK